MKHQAVAAQRLSSDWPMIIGVVIMASFVLLYRLGNPAVYWWDEARIAVNSLEMMHSSNPLIVTYKGVPDLWNTKPPLAVWLNALSMRVFGVNEFALRLPAALAGVGATVATAMFCSRHSDRRTGLLAAMILLGCGGFVEVHVTRTADFDSLLVLFTSLMVFATAERRYWSGAAFLCLAVFTKGVAGVLMAPGFLSLGKSIRLLIVPAFLAGATFVVFLIAREWAAPGYLKASYTYDVARFGIPADGHGGWRSYYPLNLMMAWPYLLYLSAPEVFAAGSAFPWPPFALLALRRPRTQASNLVLWCLASLLVALTIAATKLTWYVAPAYPLFAGLAALGIHRVRPVLVVYAFPLALFMMGLNVWKIEKEQDGTGTLTQRLPNFVRSLDYPNMVFIRDYRWHPDRTYDGPIEFYAQVKHARIEEPSYLPKAGEVIARCDLAVSGTLLKRNGRCAAYRFERS